MKAYKNPFPVTTYQGPEFFCDREAEIKRLTSNALNGVNTTLISIRRMGKTGLIQHLFHALEKKRNTRCLYLDIYATQSQKDFLNQLSTAIIQAFPQKRGMGRQVLDFITSLRPVIAYDSLTGQPEVSFQAQRPQQREQSLASLLRFLDGLNTIIVIAIDEFQQIVHYPEKNTEALLRTLIQPLKNLRFIFSGSSRHILTEMFTGNKRPFFGSSQLMELKAIEADTYTQFIERQFRAHRRKPDAEALSFILQWTRRHTYYTQFVCNRLFADGETTLSLAYAQRICAAILEEQATGFLQYRTLLTASQWQMLKAVAVEEKLYQPNARSFLATHKLGTPSSVSRSLQALLQKELIYQEPDENGLYYQVHDCFLARWLARS